MPRYVILLHEMPAGADRATHWDLMLEAGDVLRTWALSEEPRYGASLRAEQLADHRQAYLDYEGPVSGDRGRVSRWDAGDYTIDDEREGGLAITLRGSRLSGRMTLDHQDADAHFWIVSVSADPMRG